MSIPQTGGGPIERHEQLAEYLASGCKPRDQWRIGTEHEKFGYCRDTLNPLPYDGPRSIKAMLEGLQQRSAGRRSPRAAISSGWKRTAPTSASSRAGSWNCRARRSRRSTRPATR